MALNLGGLFGEGEAFRQLMIWEVGGEVITALMAPGLARLTQLINEATLTTPLSPEVAADLVVRGFMASGDGEAMAKLAGVAPGDFARLVKGAGDAPSTTTLVEAFRRRLIPRDSGDPAVPSLATGIREGRLDNKWIPMILGLGDVPIGVADAVDAVVEGQIPFDQGAQFAYENGISAENFRILYNTRGNPPSPTQLAEMVHRGVIPLKGKGPDVLSFEQGISEGATKDKWIPAYEQVMPVLPPARTITALHRNGTIDSTQALAWYKQLGLPQDVAAAYVKDASHGKTSTARTVAKGDILKLYADKLISRDEALTMLADLGWEKHDAELELELEDFHLEVAARSSAVTKVRSLFLARRISRAEVVNVLGQLGVGGPERDQLLQMWTLERDATLRILTVAEITSAYEYKILSEQEALAALVSLGYTEYDAWVILSIKAKAPLEGRPAGGPSPADRLG